VLNALCEHCVESDEACVDEVAAMAAAHAAVTGDAYQCHPEAHGERVGADAENRVYFASGNDARLWRWEKPSGSIANGHRASSFGTHGQSDPGFGTVCVDARECRALASCLEASKSAKDRALVLYLRETHLPFHDALEEKAARLARVECARLEDLERRRLMKASYDEMDRKRSGRIAVKIAEDAERRRLREEAEEAEAEALAVAKARDAATHRSRVRWMLLPPRLRPAEVPEGMDAAAAASAEFSSASEEDPPGSETVGRYVRVLWADDGAWYDAIVTKFSNGLHTLKYLADDTVETLDLRLEQKRWCSAEDYVTPAGFPIPPPAREPFGLDERGVKSGEDATGSTVLFVRKPKRLEPVVAEASEAEAQTLDAAETKNAAADIAGERKRHACRVCLTNGVVSQDHAKFGKRCPFHPQFSGLKPRLGVEEVAAKNDGDEDEDQDQDENVAKKSASPSAPPETGTPPRPSSEADERPNPAVPPACGFQTAAVAVSSAVFGGQAHIAGKSARGEA
jgi:hypothetical protein